MLTFPNMLVGAAQEAGMPVPPNPDNFSAEDYPHFQVFCNVQLCRRMTSWTEHWENARIVAALSLFEVKRVTLPDLLARGLRFAT